LNQAGVKWVSRVSETLTEAKTIVQEGSKSGPQSADGTVHWFSRELSLPQGRERWVVVYTQSSLQRAQQMLQRQVSKAQTTWEQKCWHLGNRRFACEADARAEALLEELHGIYGYTESDEISLLFRRDWNLFDREVEKLVSISASIASATFTLACQRLAHFDSRIWLGIDHSQVIE
jgi:hypothetical protein